MVMDPSQIVLWAAMFGILIGIVWSLKYIVILDRRIERLEKHTEKIVKHIEKAVVKKRR
jgi:hypothetical protein